MEASLKIRREELERIRLACPDVRYAEQSLLWLRELDARHLMERTPGEMVDMWKRYAKRYGHLGVATPRALAWLDLRYNDRLWSQVANGLRQGEYGNFSELPEGHGPASGVR